MAAQDERPRGAASQQKLAFSPSVAVTTEVQPQVRGKFLFLGDEKLYIRGATYGTFRPNEASGEYPDPEVVEQDFRQMAANGINAVRTYTMPPCWVLDTARRHGIWVMIGLPIERYITFLDDRKRRQEMEEQLRGWVRTCAGHPVILAYTLGNEIPSAIVRWYGRRRLEGYLRRLYRMVKAEDPGTLVTYVNYPSTEYLQLPFVDFCCFNLYLESPDRFEAYLARLQNIAGDRPLVLAEVGLDSRRNGEYAQARAIDWQIRTSFERGAAGMFVYAWTDEWHRGGEDVEDWDFGLTDRGRQPKPALVAARRAFAETPFSFGLAWPRISVVVCSYNGARTIRDCLEGLQQLEYPDFEVLVVDDGSTDPTPDIAREYDVRLIRTKNCGLSSARNVGLAAATGEIVAYIDDDAYPDPDWLTYLARTFMNSDHAGVGGPNLAPPGDGAIADCVANAPGGPIHVLVSDEEAEHIPGCNMAFRKDCLEAIGGFDSQYRVAGDDVDICWRLQRQGYTLGFSPAAVVWHHRRNSLRHYWRQQRGYGKAEALLERKWPEKYNAAGHPVWAGRLYGKGPIRLLYPRQGRIYHGTWGSAPFQSLYQPGAGTIWSLPQMPEYYLLLAALMSISLLGILWAQLLLALPVLALGAGAPLLQAVLSAGHASFTCAPRSRFAQAKLYGLTACLHVVQPMARLYGRLCHGLTPWRWRVRSRLVLPWPRTCAAWSETWREHTAWLHSVEEFLRAQGAAPLRGGDYDRWDLEVQGGLLGAARLRAAVEDYPHGKQLARFRLWPRCSGLGLALTGFFGGLAAWAVIDRAWAAGAILGLVALLLVLRAYIECAKSTAAILVALKQQGAGRA